MLWEYFHHTLAGLHYSKGTVDGKTKAVRQRDSFDLRRTPTLRLEGWITFVVCVAAEKTWAVALILRNQEKARWNSSTWWSAGQQGEGASLHLRLMVFPCNHWSLQLCREISRSHPHQKVLNKLRVCAAALETSQALLICDNKVCRSVLNTWG